MPCRDWDNEEHLERLSDKIDALTRMLCWMCEHHQWGEAHWHQDVREWWVRHQAKDAAKRAERAAAYVRVASPPPDTFIVNDRAFSTKAEAIEYALSIGLGNS